MSRHDDDGNGCINGMEARQNLEDVAVRQVVIHDGNVRLRDGVEIFGLLARGSAYHLKPAAFEEFADRCKKLRLVVNYQNSTVSHKRTAVRPPNGRILR